MELVAISATISFRLARRSNHVATRFSTSLSTAISNVGRPTANCTLSWCLDTSGLSVLILIIFVINWIIVLRSLSANGFLYS